MDSLNIFFLFKYDKFLHDFKVIGYIAGQPAHI